MSMFNLCETVIDTRTHETAEVVSIIPQEPFGLVDIYVLSKSNGEFYLSDDSHLVAYDKYYWDDLNTESIKED